MAAASGALTAAAPWSTPRRLRAHQIAVRALCGLLLLVGAGTLSRARGAMKTIGKDAGPSILAAQEIRSSLADLDANAANLLLGTPAQRVAALDVFEKRRVQATGRLVDAAQNITYEGERAPIQSMMEELGRYLELVVEARLRRIRVLERGGRHAEAVELCIGTAPNESNAAFERFDQALGKVLQINRDEFDRAISEGEDALERASTLDPLAAIAIAILTWLGLRPRLREYDG